jgi:hypothetical protein
MPTPPAKPEAARILRVLRAAPALPTGLIIPDRLEYTGGDPFGMFGAGGIG